MAKFQEIESAVESLDKQVKQLTTDLQALIKTVNSNSKSQSNLAEKTKAVTKATDQISAVEKERIRVAAQTKKVFAQTLALQEKGTKKLIKGQVRLADARKKAREEAKKELKLTQQRIPFTQKLTKAFSASLLKITAVIAAVKGLIAVGKAYIENIKEVNSQTTKTQQAFDLTRERAAELTKDIRAIAAAFDKDFNDVLKSSNILSKEFGIAGSRALKLIESGFRKGADVNGEFLELLKEYPAQLKAVGLSAEQSIALITQTEQQGLFSDKGIDAIKEAGIRLRELTPATEAALEAIGLSGTEIQRQLKNGEKTLFEVTQDVSKKLSELPPQSKEVGTAIADIFGGPGEDVGLRFLTTLQDIDLELNNIKTTLSPVEESSASLKEQWRGFVDEVAKGEGVASRFLAFTQKTLALNLKIVKDVIRGEKQINVEKDKSAAEEAERLKALEEAAQLKRALIAEEIRLQKQLGIEKFNAVKKAEEATNSLLEKISNDLEASIEEDINNTIAAAEAMSIAIEEDSTATAEQLRNTSKAFAKAIEEDQQEVRDNITTTLSAVSELTNTYFDFKNSLRDNEIDGIERQRDAEIAAAEKAGQDTSKIEEKFAKKEARLRTEQAKAEKRQALFNIAINTALGIIKTIGTAGFPAAIPLIIAVGAIGALQAAAVASKPIPKFKHGTDGKLQLDTTAIVGDGGKPELITTPEGDFLSPATDALVNLPRGSQVFGGDSPETKAAISGGMSTEHYNGLIQSNKRIEKAISNQPKHMPTTTWAGHKYIVKKVNSTTTYLDKYFG